MLKWFLALIAWVMLAQAPAEMTFVAPQEGAVVAGQTRLEVALDEALGDATVNYYLDLPSPPQVPEDWQNYVIGGSNFRPFSLTWNVGSATEGRHTLTAVATLADNKQVAKTVTVVVQLAK